MQNKKEIIKFIEQNGFEIKGKTLQNWKICYSIKSLNENYSISISPLTTKKLNKALLDTVTYWKYIYTDETTPYKAIKEIEKLLNNIKSIIKAVKENKWHL